MKLWVPWLNFVTFALGVSTVQNYNKSRNNLTTITIDRYKHADKEDRAFAARSREEEGRGQGRMKSRIPPGFFEYFPFYLSSCHSPKLWYTSYASPTSTMVTDAGPSRSLC